MSRIGLMRALAVAVLALALGGIGMPVAVGHASQTGSTPAAGAVLDAPPSSVEVTFDTPLMDIGAALVVRSEDGTVISEAVPEVARTRIRVGVQTDAPPGTYTVAFRVVSQDGHPITSTFDYTVTGNASAATASDAPSTPTSSSADAEPTSEEPSDGPPIALIAAGLLVLTLAAAGAIALRR